MAKITVKEQIAAAVTAALANAPVAVTPAAPSIGAALIAATTPAAPAPVLTGRALYENLLSPTQADACEEFVVFAKGVSEARATQTAQADAIVARMFPSPTDKDTWLAIAADLTKRIGGEDAGTTDYGRKVLVDAYKRKHTALPTKGASSGSAVSPGMNVKKASRKFRSLVDDVIAYAAELSKYSIDAPTLAAVTTALASLDVACAVVESKAKAA